jgi:hypothetical protein
VFKQLLGTTLKDRITTVASLLAALGATLSLIGSVQVWDLATVGQLLVGVSVIVGGVAIGKKSDLTGSDK